MILSSIFLFFHYFASRTANGQITAAKEQITPYRDHLSSIKKTYEWGTYIREDDIVPPIDVHEGTVIFLHTHISHGTAMRVWVEWMRQNMSDFSHMKIIYPTAPYRYYSIFPEARQKEKFEIWFDLDDCTPNGTEYREYLHLSALDLKQIIQEEVDAGIPMNKIIIGGFAYGGTMALHMGYRYMTDLAGVFLLSSYLQTDSIIYKELPSKDHFHLPILFMAQGDEDKFIQWQWGRATFDKLKEHGVVGTFHIIPKAEHKLTIWEIDLLWRWVRRIVPRKQIS